MTRAWMGCLHAGWIAPLWFALAVWLAGLRIGYDPALRAVGDLGAVDAPRAALFNIAGFVIPGVLMLVFAVALEKVMTRDGAGRAGRLGTGLLMISSVAFAAQGVFPFDPDEPEGLTSQRHASTLAFAILGLMAGALLVAASLRRVAGWRVLTRFGPALAGVLLVFLAQPPQAWLPMLEGRVGHAQRVVFAIHLSWFALAAIVALGRERTASLRR
ncbi:DUF998 domain-containing protein [Xanthomonadaceae bacterium JHOS43]|nr:DUF998 domain-containing protein [Xanthomonadaceae bacterium JHOS43]MCX7564025.1 DUF998 domain-containing protein [Xanthomonadaceae bacterium XH05]